MDITSSVFLIERASSFYLISIPSKAHSGTLNLKSKLNFSQSPCSILFWVKVSSTPPKKNPVQRHKRGVDFGKFLLVKPAWNLGRNLHQEKKISDWKPFSSIKMLEFFFFKRLYSFSLIKFCKIRCFLHILMSMQIYIDHRHLHIGWKWFSSHLCFYFNGENFSIYYSFNIGGFYFCGRSKAESDLISVRNARRLRNITLNSLKHFLLTSVLVSCSLFWHPLISHVGTL